MRVWPVAMALSIAAQAANSQPASDAVSLLKSCFQMERALQPDCLEKLSRELADRNGQNSAEPAARSWILSETTSPVDYSPTITATTLSQPGEKDAPATFVIRCRNKRTELLVGTEGSWRASRANEVQVDFKIDDQPTIRMQWMASADGRMVHFKGDASRFLRSLPNGRRIIINVTDGQGMAHEASFQLAGLDAIRQKISAACKWMPATEERRRPGAKGVGRQ
jgi:hypothetical protein